MTAVSPDSPSARDAPIGALLSVDIIHDDGDWTAFCEDLEGRIEAAVAAVGAWPGLVDRPSDVAIALSSDAHVAKLNHDFRGQAKPTNVLSFPAPPAIAGLDDAADGADLDDVTDAPEGNGPSGPHRHLLGDIVLAEETLLREARDLNVTPGDHLQHLVVHGLLHLVGYDHQDSAAAEVMESLETAILATLGVADPYLDTELE